jgi:hypothetical protein
MGQNIAWRTIVHIQGVLFRTVCEEMLLYDELLGDKIIHTSAHMEAVDHMLLDSLPLEQWSRNFCDWKS